MRRAWGIGLAASLALAGCDVAGVAPKDLAGTPLDSAVQTELVGIVRDFLSAQQASQQVNVTGATLIADNSAGLLSNNGASLTRNAPLVAANSGGLLSNNGSTYRVAVTRDASPVQHVVLPDGNHFYRLGNPAAGAGLVETFVTRVPNVSTGFQVDDVSILVHSRMTVTLGDFDPIDWNTPVTNHYAIEVLKSPVFTNYRSDIRITAPPLGKTQLYVENAQYTLGTTPVTASATHSAFVTFGKGAQAVDLPTSGEERIRIGDSLLALSYQNASGQGVGSGTWSRGGQQPWPLTYTYDFEKNQAQMRVNLPEDRVMRLAVRPGMQVEGGDVVTASGESLATLVTRADGTILLRFSGGEESVLFE